MTEMLESFIKSESFTFYVFVAAFIIGLAIVFYLIECTLFFEKCAVLYHKFRIRNDLYHYVRKINIHNGEWFIKKTFEGFFGSVYCGAYRYISDNKYKSSSQVQSAFKIYQYSLTRLENSKEFNYFKLSLNRDDIKTKSIESDIRGLLYSIFNFIREVWEKDDLKSIDTTLYFNGTNLSEMLKKWKYSDDITYSDLVDTIININCTI